MLAADTDVLIFVEDPGAANLIVDLPSALSAEGHRGRVLATGDAAPYLRSAGAEFDELELGRKVAEIIEAYAPRLVVVGTSENPETSGLKLVTLARQQGIEAGAELAVIGQDIDGSIASELYRVAAIVDSPVELVNSLGIVAAIDDVRVLLQMGDEAHEIIVHVQEVEQVAQAVAGLGAQSALAEAEVKPWNEVVPQLAGIIELMNVYTLVILGIVFLASAAGIANTMLMSTFERRRELGMLLALGSSPGRLGRMVATEAVLLGLLGVALGTALGVFFALLTAGSGFDFAELGGTESFEVGFQGVQVASRVYPNLHGRDVIAGGVAVLVTALSACVWPMVHISKLEPVEAMRG